MKTSKRKGYLGRYKKGNAVLDGITIMVVLTIFAITSIYGSQIFDELNTDIQTDTTMGEEAQAISGNLYGNYNSTLDNAFLLAFVLFVIFVVVSVFVIDTHPIFFVISIFMVIGVFVAGGMIANAYDDVVSDNEISLYANEFPFTGWIMSHLVELILGITFLVMIAMFTKFKAG